MRCGMSDGFRLTLAAGRPVLASNAEFCCCCWCGGVRLSGGVDSSVADVASALNEGELLVVVVVEVDDDHDDDDCETNDCDGLQLPDSESSGCCFCSSSCSRLSIGGCATLVFWSFWLAHDDDDDEMDDTDDADDIFVSSSGRFVASCCFSSVTNDDEIICGSNSSSGGGVLFSSCS